MANKKLDHLASPLLLLPLAKLIFHLVTFRGYGFFRDEFYYIVCSDRLAFGYVDHPPLSMLLLRIMRAMFGDSLFAVRLLPAIAGALTVLVSGLIARRFGGGRFAQSLVMVIVATQYLSVFHAYSMNALDVLLWATSAYVLVVILSGRSKRAWVALGAVVGLGLLNKISMMWFGAALLPGLLLSTARGHLHSRWPWIAALIATVMFLPHVLWQITNDWPTIEFIRNASGQKMIEVQPWAFVTGQLSMFDPPVTPIWLLGLVFLLALPSGRRFGVLGWIYGLVFLLLMLNGTSRAGYLGPAYVWLIAAGGVMTERLLRGQWLWWLRIPLVIVILVYAAIFAPLYQPLLPIDRYISYAQDRGVAPSTDERKQLAQLPQRFADMHGWEELVETTARVFESLPLADREKAAIFTWNYGNSGAIDVLGESHGLPKSISGHNNYWLWGPRGYTGEVMIVIGGREEWLSDRFESVEHLAIIECDYCMPYENNKPVWVCRGLIEPLAQRWPQLKHYD